MRTGPPSSSCGPAAPVSPLSRESHGRAGDVPKHAPAIVRTASALRAEPGQGASSMPAGRDGGMARSCIPFGSPGGEGESSCSGRTRGARARAAPLSCPTGLRPAPVSFPTGQGCAGARLCPRAGGQRGLTLLLPSFCSSRALKELWVGTLLGTPEGAKRARVTPVPSSKLLKKELSRRHAWRTFSAGSLERLMEGQAEAGPKQGPPTVPSSDGGGLCHAPGEFGEEREPPASA
ncbi:uncharacterized protein ACIBXB_001065 isoform 1-T1 [Morphnus guianensis]